MGTEKHNPRRAETGAFKRYPYTNPSFLLIILIRRGRRLRSQDDAFIRINQIAFKAFFTPVCSLN